MAIDFVSNFDGGADTLPIASVFDFKEWRKEANHKKIVRPEEDHDLLNNKGQYEMTPERFNIIVL